MMKLKRKQKKYILRKLKKGESLERIANDLKLPLKELKVFLEKKYKNEVIIKSETQDTSFLKVKQFNFKDWWSKKKFFIFLLIFLVFVAYVNSLNNEFLSDDIESILNNKQIKNFSHIFSTSPIILRNLINFFIVNIFGFNPLFFRLPNIFFHLGSVLALFFLTDLLFGLPVSFFSTAILAVHPLQTESVSWISGGLYSQYSFFIVLGLLAYIFSLKHKNFYYLSLFFFFLSLISSEKAMVFPFLLLLMMLSYKWLFFWKKLIIPFVLGAAWILFYLTKVSERISGLQTLYFEPPPQLNPLIQVPLAVTSYFQLIFWPKDLTLYHSEMFMTQLEYFVRLVIFVFYLLLIIWSFFKQKPLFFWLSFLLVALLPTLTPWGISWIVAERYVYLGAMGIFVVLALILKKFWQLNKNLTYIFFGILITALLIRTIFRNHDWQNQDNLWLAAAKTSPSSFQNHNNLGDMYYRHGEPQKAIEEFKKAIELRPTYADAYHNLANVYFQTKQIDLAVENYQQALKFNPRLWQSYQNLAVIYLQQNKLKEAFEVLNKALEIKPDEPALYDNLGAAYTLANEKEKAIEAFKKALSLNPQDEGAKRGLINLGFPVNP